MNTLTQSSINALFTNKNHSVVVDGRVIDTKSAILRHMLEHFMSYESFIELVEDEDGYTLWFKDYGCLTISKLTGRVVSTTKYVHITN